MARKGWPFLFVVFIDDATSQVVWLDLADSESVEIVMTGMRNYIENLGALYQFMLILEVSLVLIQIIRNTQK